MKCSKCGSNNLRVMDTFSDLDEEIYRRRKCLDCGEKIYTVEYEVEPNEEFKKAYGKANRTKHAKYKDSRYRGPVVVFKRNNF